MPDSESKSISLKSIPDLKMDLIVISSCIVLIYIFNNLVYSFNPFLINDPTGFFWKALKYIYQPDRIGFLSKDFTKCLWAVNLFLFFTLLGYFSFFIHNSKHHTMIVNGLANILAILAVFVIFLVFPFVFDSTLWINIIKVLLLFSIVLLFLNTARVLIKQY
jgi:hypothetical protein